MDSLIKIVLKKKITIKYNKENIKTFDVSHILYCDKIFSGSTSLRLYCGYCYKDDNKIDKNDKYMYKAFFEGNNGGGHPDIHIRIFDYDFSIESIPRNFLNRSL
tara:strand:+ start:164 stop:475 length:312 start_codon:yes stop_codon:yes gene_type:complete